MVDENTQELEENTSEENTEVITNDTPDENTDPQDPSKDENPEDKAPEEEAKDKPEEEPEEENDDKPAYNAYEDPALKQAVNIMSEANLPVEEANAIFKEAVDSGDLSKINKQALIDKLGKDKADVVLVLAESYYNTTYSKLKARQEEAYTITGGEENFGALRDYVKDRTGTDASFAEDMKEFRVMLDSGQPRAIKAAITELFDIYKQDPNTTISANLEVGDKTPNKAETDPLSRSAYTDLINKAMKDGSYDRVSAKLWARRQSGINQGI